MASTEHLGQSNVSPLSVKSLIDFVSMILQQ